MESEPSPVLRAVILGSDALLAARPATPVQLARACLREGFDFVAPVSWGEELLAERVVAALEPGSPSATIAAHCPFVAEALRSQRPSGTRCISGVAPPVAAARYLRTALGPRPVHVTYVGGCPGATVPDVDEWLPPQELLSRLLDHGVIPEEQPHHYDGVLPPERARYASLPGGIPAPDWLVDTAGAVVREAAPATLAAVTSEITRPTVIDLQVATGCVCADDRFAVAQLEPPRSRQPVIDRSLAVGLANASIAHVEEAPFHFDPGLSALEAVAEPPADRFADQEADRRATIGERGWSDREGDTTVTPSAFRLTVVVEPWTSRSSSPSEQPVALAPHPTAAQPTVAVQNAPDVVLPALIETTAPVPFAGGSPWSDAGLPAVRMRMRVKPSGLSPVPPPWLERMQQLELQNRHARRVRLFRRGIVIAVLSIAAAGVPVLLRWPIGLGSNALPAAGRLVAKPDTSDTLTARPSSAGVRQPRGDSDSTRRVVLPSGAPAPRATLPDGRDHRR